VADVKKNATPKRRMLYHYTDQSVLPEIVRGDSIWLTDVRYLNDSAEYVYCVELVKKLLHEVPINGDRAESFFSFYAFREIPDSLNPSSLHHSPNEATSSVNGAPIAGQAEVSRWVSIAMR